uniref:putative uncharacterized protein DDB_G0282499 n=1 Tax=Erigeron canadensis TaxID=72917 RepID=UPI001CB96B3D|nr:putative uncharacterized protein DDB_G0282499 [Erigeron canadensis]
MLLPQNPNVGNIQEQNNVVRVKNEPSYSQNESIDNASVASSNNMDLNPHQFNGTPSNVIHQPYLLPNPDNTLDAHSPIVGNQGDNRSPHNPLTNSQNSGPEEQLQSQRSSHFLPYDPNSHN